MSILRKALGFLVPTVLLVTVGFAAAQIISGGIISSWSSGQTTTGSPYSLTQITEHTQTLADGTHIITKTKINLFRDSAGRTRREMFLAGPGQEATEPTLVQIEDTVAGVSYSLQIFNHTAQAIHYGELLNRASNFVPPVPQPKARVPNPRPHPKTSTEDLGYQTIDGLEAYGIRMTTTLPTGSEGNDGPIVITNERWFSEDLKLEVLVKTSDPRTGESVMRITNLNRSEPDPTLFRVPPDYTLTDSGN